MAAKKRSALRRILLRFAVALVGFILVVGTFLALGGARIAIELFLPAAMNGYVKVGKASYYMFGAADTHDIELVLDWRTHRETVLKIGSARARPRLFPLALGRLQFGTTIVDDVQLNLRMLEGDRVNIDRLFRAEDRDGKATIRVYPPSYSEITNLQFSFAPFTWKPIQVDSARMAFRPVSLARSQVLGVGQINGPLIGAGAAAIFLDLDDAGYIVSLESSSIEVGLDTMNQLPVSPDIDILRTIMPSGRLRYSALIAGRRNVVERLKIAVELQDLGIHSLQYPLSLTNTTGRISTDGRTVKVENLRGLLPISGTEAVLNVDGTIHPDASFEMDVCLSNLLVSDALFSYLPTLSKVPDFVSINGEASISARLFHKPDWAVPRAWADIAFRGQAVLLDFPVPTYDAQAHIRIMPSGSAVFDQIDVDVGTGSSKSRVTATGTFDPLREYVQVFFASEGIAITNDIIARLPQVPQFVTSNLRIEGRLPVEGEFALASESVYVDTRGRLENFAVSLVDFPDVGASSINAAVQYAAERVIVSDLTAKLLAGSADLDIELNFARDNRSFDGELILSDVDLSRIPKEYRGERTGKLSGKLQFHGDDLQLKLLKLDAELFITDGHIEQLPLIVSIINFLNLQLPGEIVFTSASARFTVENETVDIERIEVSGEKLNVYVRGTIGFDGKLKLRSGVGYRKPFLEEVPLLGWLFGLFTSPLRSALTTVDVRGTVEKPSISLVSVQYLTSPFTAVLRFFGEAENEAAEPSRQ